MPNNGVIFGDPNLSLVLRGIQMNDDLTLSDIPEPASPLGIVNQTLNPFELLRNYPNPFDKFTNIQFAVNIEGRVMLDVYDIKGTKIVSLINQKLAPGIYETTFDSGSLEEGFYFYKLTMGENSITKKMILIR